MGKVIFVSYRLPVSIEIGDNEEVKLQPVETNVLNTAVDYMREQGKEVVWVGSFNPSSISSSESTREKIVTKLEKELEYCVPIFMDSDLSREYYNVFCKGVVWPLFHYYGGGTTFFSTESWEAYKTANELFAKKILSVYKEGDLILIQDYHLMLLPQLLRQLLPLSKISFYNHIPWPTSELYRSLPVRNKVLEGLLGADIIGFQTFPYARHFLSAVTRILGHTATEQGVEMPNGHFVRVEVDPVGIDSNKFHQALSNSEVKQKIEEMKKKYQDKKIIVSRDPMEYIQGIPHKLKMFSAFLDNYPEWRGKVVMFQACVPNSDILSERNYKQLIEDIEKLVGSINGKYGSIEYSPLIYLNKKLRLEEITSMFACSDVGVVTALRDGMNVAAFEYVACQAEKQSPLVLSEFAGAASCLSGAMIVNPWDQQKCTETLHEALTMTEEHKKIRYYHNRDYVFTHTASFWINHHLNTLMSTRRETEKSDIRRLNIRDMLNAYKKSKKRLLLLDYDGTLTPIVKVPTLAVPSEEIISLLTALSQNERNVAYVITGRERRVMDDWLSGVPIGLSCEHGCFFRPYIRNDVSPWRNCTSELDLSWKGAIKAILDDYADRTPGSFVETKEINVSWHYRNADAEFAEYQKKDLVQHLQDLPNLPIEILPGKKVVEVRPKGISKASVVRRILQQEADIDFVLCVGDDKTDEDMFDEVNKKDNIVNRFSITVEKKDSSLAMYYTDNQRHVIDALTKLAYS